MDSLETAPLSTPDRGLGFLIDFLLPDEVRNEPPEQRSQARLLVCLLLFVVGVALSMVIGNSWKVAPAPVTIGWVMLVGASVLLVSARNGASRSLRGTIMLTGMFVASMGFVFASGGKAIPAVMGACVMPLMAYGVQGRRAAIGWSVAVLAGVATTALYAQTTSEFLYRGEMLAWEHWRFASFGLMVFLVLFLILGLDWVLERLHTESNQLHEQIHRQGARYRELVENVGDLMLEYDAETRCVYASPILVELLGRQPQELLRWGFLDLLHKDDRDEMLLVSREIAKEPGRTLKFKARILHARGHWLHGEISARSFYDGSGELRFVTIFRDLSELYRAQLAMRHGDRLASAGTLAAGIAHQINNPVGSIRNASEFALVCAKDGDYTQVEGVLRGNIEQAIRCGEIVRSLLQFAAPKNPEKTVGDLRSVVQRACSLAQSYGHERGVEILLAGGDEPFDVSMSEIEIEQVLVNLVRNAIESHPDAHRIEVRVERCDDQGCVEVRDDGRGIPESELAQVFDPFFTTRLEEGGSGLGLSVALGIVRDHAGELDIESVEGEGTRVRMAMPLVSNEESRATL